MKTLRQLALFLLLAVHLLRPIGAQQDKQAKQREAIGTWATDLLARAPGATVIIVGDTNNTDRQPLYGVGREAGELNAFAATHLTNKCYDRLVVAGAGKWQESRFYGLPTARGPTTPTSGWTDHYFVGAVLRVE